MVTMPMFPLGSVLFPSMPLTLRIFEERYLRLLGDLMTAAKPEFGVVLVARASGETDGGPMAIGTIASVTEIGTTDEFLGLESHGTRRFRVTEWLPDDPYPIADIEYLPDLTWTDDLLPSRIHLESQVRHLLTLASRFGEMHFGPNVELSDDPVGACWQLAGVLPIGELDRFDLLSVVSTEDLISQTYEIVTAAIATLGALFDNNGDDEPHHDSVA